MIINEVPEWLPTVNLILRTALLLLLVAYMVRHHARIGTDSPRWITLEAIAVAMAIILVAGAAFQAGFLSLPDWTLIGTWGSLVTAIMATLLLAWRD